jgi:hypothetical protein
MPLPEKDLTILRGLAQRIAEIAALPVQEEKADLWRRLNRLERVRPLILLQNATWHETGGEIQLQCEDEWARGQEWGLRATLYHWDHMRDDSVYEGFIASPIHVGDTGWGVQAQWTRPDHVFGAAQFEPVVHPGDDPERIPLPTVTVDWEATDRAFNLLNEVYGDILPVRKQGVAGHWFAIMDDLIQWCGIENTFVAMVDCPEWVHAWLERMTQWHLSRLDQYEKLGVLSLNNRAVGVGPGGLGITDDLPQPDFDGEHVRTIDQWGHATTQIFSEVSPAMHIDFALDYEARFLRRFGLAGYGCCEPLDLKVDIARAAIPNLRRISMSPRANVERGAEAVGDSLIFSHKPNPQIIGMEAWHPDLVRDQLRDVFDKTRGCVIECIMKDLHTCRGEPRRMWEWVRIAMEVAEEYA